MRLTPTKEQLYQPERNVAKIHRDTVGLGALEKRTAIYVAEIVAREGWATQIAAAVQANPADAPHLTTDGAMLLVQSQLTRVGATRACTRAEVACAFEYLTNPILGNAIWLDADRNAIVITREPL